MLIIRESQMQAFRVEEEKRFAVRLLQFVQSLPAAAARHRPPTTESTEDLERWVRDVWRLASQWHVRKERHILTLAELSARHGHPITAAQDFKDLDAVMQKVEDSQDERMEQLVERDLSLRPQDGQDDSDPSSSSQEITPL